MHRISPFYVTLSQNTLSCYAFFSRFTIADGVPMTLKILLPLLVALLLYFLGKSHARRGGLASPVAHSRPTARSARWSRAFRLVAFLLAGVSLLSAIWIVYEEWQAAHKTVVVRVIHVQTGATTTYQALQGQVHGRSFQTLDGRQVRLADVERMEVEE
ncbi:MAG: hypothetical protein H7837_00535 [Magnetococcus sp. MYC-9]